MGLLKRFNSSLTYPIAATLVLVTVVPVKGTRPERHSKSTTPRAKTSARWSTGSPRAASRAGAPAATTPAPTPRTTPLAIESAVSGAPVTDWRLYDTHYTERYLGHPTEHPDHYDQCNLILEAHELTRPLLLIHGLADDNVVAAHTLQLSRALLEAGRPHQVLPLSGVTHMTPQESVAENLLLLQRTFLDDALGLDRGGRGT